MHWRNGDDSVNMYVSRTLWLSLITEVKSFHKSVHLLSERSHSLLLLCLTFFLFIIGTICQCVIMSQRSRFYSNTATEIGSLCVCRGNPASPTNYRSVPGQGADLCCTGGWWCWGENSRAGKSCCGAKQERGCSLPESSGACPRVQPTGTWHLLSSFGWTEHCTVCMLHTKVTRQLYFNWNLQESKYNCWMASQKC